MSATTPGHQGGPYRGLTYFTEDDAEFFFGREAERDLVVANLKARRLSLLYGPSGVGKSSLMQAGVAATLSEIAHRDHEEFGAPEFIPVVFNDWRDDPMPGLTAAVAQAAARFGADQIDPTGDLIEVLHAAAKATGAATLLILDQFEEYFLYHPSTEGTGSFAEQFPQALVRPHLPAGFLVGIREDALAQLDRYKGRVPHLFDSYRRVNPLGAHAAEQAIRRPLQEYNRQHPDSPPVRIEDELVEEVIRQVAAGSIKLDQVGAGTVKGSADKVDAIEASYLQLVMTRLWEADDAEHSHLLRLATLRALGDSEAIVKSHLDTTLNALSEHDREIAADVFHQLVTPSGTKIVHTVADLAEYTEHSEAEIGDLLERLNTGTRIVRLVPPPLNSRGAPRYEIFHDMLAPSILDWRGRQEAVFQAIEKDKARHEARVQRRNARVARTATLIVLVLVLATTALWLNTVKDRNAIQSRQLTIQSRQLAEDAASNLDSDPELSTLLALSALRKSNTPEAQAALRQAYETVQEEATFNAGHDVTTVAFSPDGRLIAAGNLDNGNILTWSLDRPREKPVLLHTLYSSVRGIAFSPDGASIAVVGIGADGGRTGVPDVEILDATTASGPHQTVPVPKAAGTDSQLEAVAYAPNDKYLATTNDDGQLCLFSLPSYRPSCSKVLGTHDYEPSVAFDRNGSLAVTSTSHGASVWSVPALKIRRSVFVGDLWIEDAAINPAGTKIATASGQGWTDVWNIVPTVPKPVDELDTIGWTGTAAFNAEGTQLVTAGDAGQTTVWRLANGEQVAQLDCHCGVVYSAAFDPNGKSLVVTGNGDGKVQLWDSEPRELTSSYSIDPDGLTGATYVPSMNDAVAVTADGTAVVENLQTRQSTSIDADSIAVDAKSPATLVAGASTGVTLWSLASGKPHLTKLPLRSFEGTVEGVAISRSGRYLAIGFNNAYWPLVYDTKTHAIVYLYGGNPDGHINSIRFNAAGNRVLIGYQDGVARLWTTTKLYKKSGNTFATPLGGAFEDPSKDAVVFDAQFNETGNEIVLADDFGNATIFDTATHQQLGQPLNAGAGEIDMATFSASGGQIVTSGEDGTVRIWDIATGVQLAVFGPVDQPFPTAMTSATFSRDGRRVLTSSNDGVLRIWSTEAAAPLNEVESAARQRLTRGYTAAERSEYLNEND